MTSRPQLPIVPLLLAIAALAPAAEQGAPPATPATASQPGQAEIAADAKYTEALAKYRAGAFTEALDLVEQAVKIYPPHAGAQKLRSDVLAVLSNRDDRLKMAASWFGSLQDIRTQEMVVRLSALVQRADKAMAAGDYESAELDYDRVDIGIRSFPYRFDWGELPKQVQDKMAAARSKARVRDAQRQDEDRKAAAAQARMQTELQAQALKMKVDELMRRSQAAYDRKDYRRAEVEAWNAYDLDRRREDARELYLAARREGHYEFDVNYREERQEGLARVAEEIHKALIPQNELLVFPEDWQFRAMRKPKEIGTQKEEPWMAALNDRLEQRVTFDFQDTSFDNVVDFLRQVTGVNIIVAPAVMAAANSTVTLRVRDMRFRDALKWILDITNLHMAIQDQGIFISTDAVVGQATLRLYDVSDLITPVQDFPGIDLAYQSTGGGGGGGGAGGLVATVADDQGGVATNPDELVDFIKKNVTPADWDPTKNIDVNQRAGSTLFVSHTAEGHKLVTQLLDNLRKQSALQVNVGVRLVDVRKGFFEEIGVEWTNGGTAGSANVGMLNEATQSPQGYTRINSVGNDGSGYATFGTITQGMPGNSTSINYSGAGRGMALEGALNTSNFINQDQLNAILSASEDETDATILEQPQLTCFNGQRANASFITQYAYISDYQIVSSNYDPTIKVLNYGDLLDVRPVVSSDHKYITMEVRPTSVSLVGTYTEYLQSVYIIQGGNATVVIPGAQFPLELPNVSVQTLRSSVMLPDRGSLLLGGFNRSLRQRTQSGVPFLSHIPFLGRLFSRNGVYDEDRRTFFLLSATILALDEEESKQ